MGTYCVFSTHIQPWRGSRNTLANLATNRACCFLFLAHTCICQFIHSHHIDIAMHTTDTYNKIVYNRPYTIVLLGTPSDCETYYCRVIHRTFNGSSKRANKESYVLLIYLFISRDSGSGPYLEQFRVENPPTPMFMGGGR